MAVITFLSDFGTRDHYVAAVKAAIISKSPSTPIVDISHDIIAGDLGHAAYVLDQVFRDFPEGTIHICAIDRISKTVNKRIAIKLENHYFIGYDSGLFSLISREQPSEIIELNKIDSTFITRDLFVPVAMGLIRNESLSSYGEEITSIQKMFPRQLKVTKREISGNVIRVDNYGNLISNITREAFETILNLHSDKSYRVWFGKETSTSVYKSYFDVGSGDCFLFFNANEYLQIGLNNGNASKLIGLKHDSPITITFEN
ncbi:MAG: SAM-dependent chlorinase/fluorinase [Cyclobacteriaceae bacterium]